MGGQDFIDSLTELLGRLLDYRLVLNPIVYSLILCV